MYIIMYILDDCWSHASHMIMACYSHVHEVVVFLVLQEANGGEIGDTHHAGNAHHVIIPASLHNPTLHTLHNTT